MKKQEKQFWAETSHAETDEGHVLFHLEIQRFYLVLWGIMLQWGGKQLRCLMSLKIQSSLKAVKKPEGF